MDERWQTLRRDAEDALTRLGPAAYRQSPAAKMLAMVASLIFREIPADPGHSQYRQGTTLGASHRHWRRAKFFRRFRLFFRYHSQRKIIVYVWLNDETTLRKSGASTDVYAVFHGMLESGRPPNDFDELVQACRALKTIEGGDPAA